MKLDFKSVFVPTAVLLIICVVVSAALMGTNLLTKDKIAQQQLQKAEESRKVVLQGADSFEAANAGSPDEYYIGKSGNETVGYVFETTAKGYGGDVRVMTGISAEGAITGVMILSHGETPGLGANAEKESFRAQYRQPVPDTCLQLVKYQTPAEGQIEAITGATITSTAVTNAVNQAVDTYHNIFGGGGYDGN